MLQRAMIQGLLLAAGSSARFGGQKLLAELPGQQSVAVVSFHNLKNALDSSVVVVRAEDSELIKHFVQQEIPIVSCPENSLGMGHSIACGVAHTKDADGWLITLADMPFIKSGTIESVATALNDGALIAVPVRDGKRGHPVGFSKKMYSELVMLNGDLGARTLVQKYRSQVIEVECDDPGIHADIDTLEDLEKYTKSF